MPGPAREQIPFWGVDQRPEDRPGVPMEKDPPEHAATAHWNVPEPQRHPGFPIFKRKGLDKLTPVFGTMQPPHGLSGKLRKAAYEIPDHKPAHWGLLLVADRVDVVESQLGFSRLFALAGIAGGAAVAALRRGGARRRGRVQVPGT